MSTPDLQAVLATLAQFSHPQAPALQSSFQSTPLHNLEHLRSQVQANASQPGRAVIDPATITSWQEGLRCVTKIAAQSKSFEESIRKMIRDQRAQEMRWYSERQKLKQTQANRNKSSAEAMSILQSLRSSISQTSTTSGTDTETELAAFDQKIYRAQQSMQEAMTLDLKALGVPFFGTQPSLVRSMDDDPEEATPDLPRSSQPISSVELQQLQKRMVQHLEDLYRD